MCVFHKWSKWEQYYENGMDYGFIWQRNVQPKPYQVYKQRRKCLKCNKVQEEKV